jgi:hypothetical protein
MFGCRDQRAMIASFLSGLLGAVPSFQTRVTLHASLPIPKRQEKIDYPRGTTQEPSGRPSRGLTCTVTENGKRRKPVDDCGMI